VVVAGHDFEVDVSGALPGTPARLLVTVRNGRVVAASTPSGDVVPRTLLEALGTLSLDGVPDGRFPARWEPRTTP